MEDQKNRSAADSAGRSVSSVWLLYGIYLLVLGWMAFGSHAPDVEELLVSLGIRQVYEQRYYEGTHHVVRGHASMPGTRLPRPVVWYTPNYGGVLLYTLGGGLIAYYFSRPDRQASRVNQENALPHGGTQDQG